MPDQRSPAPAHVGKRRADDRRVVVERAGVRRRIGHAEARHVERNRPATLLAQWLEDRLELH